MFCSTIIPTIGRSTLSQAVCSVLEQDFDPARFEVIVVNDSGRTLPEMEWQNAPQVRIIQTNHRERSVARNTGASIARGKYLNFLDDDDYILPGALKTFWRLAETRRAPWLYGGYRLVDTSGNLQEECHPNESGNCFVRFIAGEWLPLQASLIEAKAFFSIEGFASLETLLGGDEDVDLSRQFSLRYDIAGTYTTVAMIRVGLDASTTNFSNLHEQSLQSREKALKKSGAFQRMRSSARAREKKAAYWHGRISWVYLASLVWNLQHRDPFTATSRGIYAWLNFGLAARYYFSKGFWQGITRPHYSKGWLASS